MGSIIGAVAGALFNACFGWISGLLQRRADRQEGAGEQRAADISKQNEVKDAQLKAAADRPADRDELADRLRTGRF